MVDSGVVGGVDLGESSVSYLYYLEHLSPFQCEKGHRRIFGGGAHF